ncbi:MAG: hypothetical protein ACRCUH_15050 [Shewanella sp.]
MKGFILLKRERMSESMAHHHAREHEDRREYHKESGSLMSMPSSVTKDHKQWESYGTSPSGLMQIVAIEFAALQAAKNNEDHRAIMMKLDDLSMACDHAKKNM